MGSAAGFKDLLVNKMLCWLVVIFGELEEGCSEMSGWMSLVPNVEHGNGLESDCVCVEGSWI